MLFSVDLVNLVLYCAQQLGITLGVGAETIPAEVVVAMARTTRAIPKTLMPQLVLEMDLAAAKLIDLQKSGIAAPEVPPETVSPGQMLGRLISGTRAAGDQGQEDADTILSFLEANPDRLGQLTSLARRWGGTEEPEYVGAYIPSPRDLVLNGHNGNGRAH